MDNTLPESETPPVELQGPAALPTFEYSLLRLARFLVGDVPAEHVAKLVMQRLTSPPPCVSGLCVRLAKDIIGKGVMLKLVRAGGWRKERFLRKNAPVTGRIWERIPLNERTLEFSGSPMAFLMWLTFEKPHEAKDQLPASVVPKTAADEVFFLLALDAMQYFKDVYPVLASADTFRKNPLCWLTHPGAVAPSKDIQAPSFDESFKGTRLAVLECLQAELTKRWIRSEREKGNITNWQTMRQQGLAEQSVLNNYVEAANKADRWDLARFILNSNSAIFLSQTNPMPSFWIGNLRLNQPNRLADRIDTQRVALSLVRQMETLREWNRRAKSVGRFDDDYDAKQLWKLDWENAQGDTVAAQAHKVLERLEPLRT